MTFSEAPWGCYEGGAQRAKKEVPSPSFSSAPAPCLVPAAASHWASLPHPFCSLLPGLPASTLASLGTGSNGAARCPHSLLVSNPPEASAPPAEKPESPRGPAGPHDLFSPLPAPSPPQPSPEVTTQTSFRPLPHTQPFPPWPFLLALVAMAPVAGVSTPGLGHRSGASVWCPATSQYVDQPSAPREGSVSTCVLLSKS